MEKRRDPGLALGAILVLLGALFLAAQFGHLDFDLGRYGWPVFVILPGLALLAAGLFLSGASGLVIPGTMITIVGLILAVQNTFDIFQTWAYAWPLVAPGGAGTGVAIQGLVRRNAVQVRAGLRTALVGLILFLGFALFFEGVIHLSGRDLGLVGRLAVPALLIGTGIWLLARRARAARGDASQAG